MKIRILGPEESVCLQNTLLAKIDLDSATVAVATNDAGETIGTMALVVLPHFEGPWIREDYRGGTILERLEWALLGKMQEYGIPRVFAFAANPEMEGYIERRGYKKLAWSVWEKEASNVVPLQK